MKIIFIGPRSIPAECGGIDTHTEKVAYYLANQEGHKVVIYARKFYSKFRGDWYKGIRIKNLPTLTSKYLDTIIYSIIATSHAVAEGADIIHYQGGSGLFSFIPYLCGFKVVCTVQASEWQRTKWGPVIKFFLKVIERMSFRWSHQFITVSRTLEEYFNNKYPNNKKVKYVSNGLEVLPPLVPSEILKYGLNSNNYILSVGRLVPEKGLHYLVEAYKELECGFKLVIAGDTLHQDAYAVHLKKMANENIIFTGFVTGNLLTELYSNAYIYVHPSELEGMSMALLEAMSFGKCVLVSDTPENRETIDKHGFCFKNKNVQDLTERLRYLIENKDTVKQIGEEAKKYVINNFRWEKIAIQLDEIYKTLCRK